MTTNTLPTGTKYAGFPRRLVAFLFDYLLIFGYILPTGSEGASTANRSLPPRSRSPI